MPMRLVLIIKVLLIIISLSGCNKKIEKITIGEWLKIVSEKSNITHYVSENPYYINIDKNNKYFKDVQSLVEWEVLDTKFPLKLDEYLNKEFLAYTLSGLYGGELDGISVKDSKDSIYSKQIEKVISLGILELDFRNCFNPKELIDKNYAIEVLDKVVNYINDFKETDLQTNYNWKDDLNIVEINPIHFDESTNEIILDKNNQVNSGEIIHFYYLDKEYYKQVEEILEDEKNIKAILSDPYIEDIFEEFKINENFDVNFDDAIIEPFNESEITSYNKMYDVINLNSNNSFKFKDFNINYKASGSTFSVDISKKNKHSIMYANASIFNLKPKIQWDFKNFNNSNGFFKIDFDSNLSFGVKKENSKNIYGDFSKIDSSNFLKTIQNIFVDDSVKNTIPICKIKVPIPNMPTATVTLKLLINFFASGKIELSIANVHSVGMEIKNKNIRIISNHKNNTDFIIKSSAKTSLGFLSSFNIFNQDIIDISLNAGANATLNSTIHLFDNEGNINSVKSNLPGDFLYDISENNKNVKMCFDMRLHKVLEIEFNSSSTLANKFGLNKKIVIFDEKNGNLLKGLQIHMENWQFVDKCTRNKSYIKNKNKLEINSDKLSIKDYSIILNKNEHKKIEILQIPKGYSKNDIKFEINNTKIAEINDKGIVVGKDIGNAIVLIKTSDEKYVVKCHILCKE